MSDYLRSRRRVLQATGVAVGASVLVGTAGADDHETASDGYLDGEIPTTFSTTLTGDAEPHDVETNASGTATFEVDQETMMVDYRIDVDWLCDPTQAHVYLGDEGEDGPVVAWLYPEDGQSPDPIEGRFDGTLATGTIEVCDLVGPLDGADSETVAAELVTHGAYVNVHTESYPDGELRGQLEVADVDDHEPAESSASEAEETEDDVEETEPDDEETGIDDHDEGAGDIEDTDDHDRNDEDTDDEEAGYDNEVIEEDD